MLNVKKIFKTFCIIAVFLSITACGPRMLHKTYEGPERADDQVAIFNWEGTWYMGLGLYKSDNNPFTGTKEDGTWPCMFNDRNHGGFNVAVIPGRRTFELFNAKTEESASVFQVTLNMEKGKTYTLEGDEKKFIITGNGKKIDAKAEPIPVYIEPGKNQPHAIFKIKGKVDDDLSAKSVALFRVDGKAGKTMYKCHTKWVTFNKDNISSGMQDFEIRLTPGTHTIEYAVLIKGAFGPRRTGFSVKKLTFNVKNGKNYIYKVIPDPDEGESGEYEDTIEIIEE